MAKALGSGRTLFGCHRVFAGLLKNACSGGFSSAISLSSESVKKLSMEVYVQRSKEVEQKIGIMSEKVGQLKQKALMDAIQKKESAIEFENQQLKREIEDLKVRIKIAEIRNGVPQVSLPKMASVDEVMETHKTEPPLITSKGQALDKLKAAGDGAVTSVAPPVKKPKVGKPGKKAAAGGGGGGPIDVSRLDLRVARIVKAEKHPDADTLYIEDVETGEEKNRTVISGLVNDIPLEEMQNRMVVLMMNLKPVKMRGILSQAMVMCACAHGTCEILAPPPGCVPGDRVTFKGYPGEPDAEINSKKKVWEQIRPNLHTDANKVACYKGVPFTVKGKGIVTAQTMANAAVR